MSDRTNIIRYVNRTLLQQRNIRVQDEWLDECIQWLQAEYSNEGTRLSENRYKDLVYEQWLMSDLREIGQASLPGNINAVQKSSTRVSGNLMLQVNYAYNIGNAAYTQLQKLKGCEIPDDDEQLELFKTGKPTNQQKTQYRGNSSRVLFFELTDGMQNIDAIEYRPIPAIKEDIVPGCKIELIGPIQCRNGILLLTAKNSRILGGNCEELINECSQIKIFRNALSLPEEDDAPANTNQEVHAETRTQIKPEGTKPLTNAVAHQATRSEYQSRDNARVIIKTNNNQAAGNVDEIGELFDDDFDLEDDCNESDQNQRNTDRFQNQIQRDSRSNAIHQNQRNARDNNSYENRDIRRKENNENQRDIQGYGGYQRDRHGSKLNQREREYHESRQDHRNGPPERDNLLDDQVFEDDLDLLNLDDELDVQVGNVKKEVNQVNVPGTNKVKQEMKYVFLTDVKSCNPNQNATVKAYVVTLLSKLEMTEAGFSVEVCIDDGSAVCNASISNNALEQVIGHSAAEILSYTKRSSLLPDRMKQAIVKCQQKLATKVWTMDVTTAGHGNLNILKMTEL